jgi:hypothetical protein
MSEIRICSARACGPGTVVNGPLPNFTQASQKWAVTLTTITGGGVPAFTIYIDGEPLLIDGAFLEAS